MKYISLLFVAFIFIAFADVANAQIVKDKRRAISLGTCVDIDQLPQDVQDLLENSDLDEYVDESSLDGMGPNKVRNAGWATVGVWNERPGNKHHKTQFCFSVLDGDADVWTLNGDRNPQVGYLDKCLKDGKRTFKNRILVPPSKVVTKEKIEFKDKIVYKDKLVEKDCPECPDDTKLVEVTTGKERLTGGLKGTAVSAGIACTISGIINKSLRDCAIDAAISAGGNRVAQAVNPSPNAVRAYCDGENKVFKRGNGGKVGGCQLEWEGNTAVLKFDGKECKSRTLGHNLNTTVFAIERNNGPSSTRKTINTQTRRVRVVR